MKMKKILSLMLVFAIVLSIGVPAIAATKVYDDSGDIPDGDIAKFYPYTIDQIATRYTPWFVQWARQKEAEYATGARGRDGNQQVMAIASSPVNPDHVLFGTDSSGVWRSTDGGINWFVLGENNNSWNVTDIIWSPYDENVAFCVQSPHRKYSSSVTKSPRTFLDGLYKTTDAGKTWTLVLPKDFISEACSNGIVKYDKHGNIFALSSEGLYKSTDDGDTWTLAGNGFVVDKMGTYSLHLFDDEGETMLVGVTGGLSYTEDGGKTWTNVSIPEKMTDCTSVTVDPLNENHWMACFRGAEHMLQETYDCGKTWSKVNYLKGKAAQIIRYVLKEDGTTRLILVYASVAIPFKYSDDGGETWITPNIADRDIAYNNYGNGYACEGLYVDKSNPGVVWYSFSDFVYKPEDYGSNFYPRSGGFTAINTNAVVFDQENRVWFCDTDRGLAHTSRPYEQGKYSPTEPDIVLGKCVAVAIDPNDVNHVLSCIKDKFYETFDRGANWREIPELNGPLHTVTQYHKEDSNFIYTMTHTSADNGKTWEKTEHQIHAVSPANNDVVYSMDNQSVLVSKDRGKTWETVIESFPKIKLIVADNFDENTFYYCDYEGDGRMHKYDNGKMTAFGPENGLTTGKGKYVSILAFAQDPKDKNHLILGGKNTYDGLKAPGIYESWDGGENWVIVPGMGGIACVVSITFSPVSEEVFVGTCSNGLLIYDYNTFKKWYNGELTEWDKSDEVILPNMYTDGKIRVKIDDDIIGFDTEPYMENDRTYVPMRKIFEKLGAKIAWDDSTWTVTATKGNRIISLKVGSDTVTIDGMKQLLETPAKLVDGRTMVPLRFVAETLGCSVEWNESNNLVVIKSK